MSPEHRAAFQQRLIESGFLHGAADGEFGPVTRDAIKKFQVTNGMDPTGFMPFRLDPANAAGNSGSATAKPSPREPPEPPSLPAAPHQVIDPPARIIKRLQEAELERLRLEQARQTARARQEETERTYGEWRRQRDLERLLNPRTSSEIPQFETQRRDGGQKEAELSPQRASSPSIVQAQPLAAADAKAQTAPASPAVTREPNPLAQALSPFWASVLLLLWLLGVGVLVWQLRYLQPSYARDVSAETPPSGRKLKYVFAEIVAFDKAGEVIKNFGTNPEVRLNGDVVSLYSSRAGRVLVYSLTKDVRAIELVETKEKFDLTKTAGRVALASMGWSMVRPRKNANVGLGSALLDLRYFGTEKYALAHIRITFKDFTRIVLECDEAQVAAIDKLIPEETGSTKAIKETEKALTLIERMIGEGSRHLEELRARISNMAAAIKAKSELANHGSTFEERDAARQEIEVLREKITVPRAALYALTAREAAS
jgi:peptidoglycan hydrolase-like protein with peptidoglycan-binding domain